MSDLHNEGQTAPILSMGVSIGGQDSLVGEIVSINLKRDPFFMIGDISLSASRYWAVVSPDREPGYYNVIRAGLDYKYLVRGKKRILAVDKPEGVLEAWYTLLKKEGRSKLSVESFRQLIKKGKDSNYSLAEIALYCLKQEENGAHREPVIGLLKEAMTYSDGSYRELEVFDEEEGKVIFKQTSAGMVVRREGADPVSAPPAGHVAGTKHSSEVLGDILEF